MVGLGFALYRDGFVSYTRTPGPQTVQNTCTAELAAVATAVTHLPVLPHHTTITTMTSNQAALLAICRPRQQLGKRSIKQIYEKVRALRARANTVRGHWVSSLCTVELSGCAKRAAKPVLGTGENPRGRVDTGQGDNFDGDEESDQGQSGTPSKYR